MPANGDKKRVNFEKNHLIACAHEAEEGTGGVVQMEDRIGRLKRTVTFLGIPEPFHDKCVKNRDPNSIVISKFKWIPVCEWSFH